MMNLKDKLREDWKQAWKFISVQSMTIAAAIQTAWVTLPDDWKASVPPHLITYLTLGCLAIGTYGVMTKQSNLKGSSDGNHS